MYGEIVVSASSEISRVRSAFEKTLRDKTLSSKSVGGKSSNRSLYWDFGRMFYRL